MSHAHLHQRKVYLHRKCHKYFPFFSMADFDGNSYFAIQIHGFGSLQEFQSCSVN